MEVKEGFENQIAKLKEEREIYRMRWKKTDGYSGEAFAKEYERIKKENNEMEKELATLKEQVEIARDFLKAEMIKSEPLSWAHEFCKVGLKDRDKDTQVIMDLQEEIANEVHRLPKSNNFGPLP